MWCVYIYIFIGKVVFICLKVSVNLEYKFQGKPSTTTVKHDFNPNGLKFHRGSSWVSILSWLNLMANKDYFSYEYIHIYIYTHIYRDMMCKHIHHSIGVTSGTSASICIKLSCHFVLCPIQGTRKGFKLGRQRDIWSLGCILCQIATHFFFSPFFFVYWAHARGTKRNYRSRDT